MIAPFRAACLQFNTGNDLAQNLAALQSMVREAAGQMPRRLQLNATSVSRA